MESILVRLNCSLKNRKTTGNMSGVDVLFVEVVVFFRKLVCFHQQNLFRILLINSENTPSSQFF